MIAGYMGWYGHKEIVIHDALDGHRICRIDQSERRKHILCCAFDPGNSLIAAGAEEYVKVWDISSRQRVFMADADARVCAVGFLEGGDVIAAVNDKGEFRSWDLTSGRELVETQLMLNENTEVSTISDGTFLPGGILLSGHGWGGVFDDQTLEIGNHIRKPGYYGRVAANSAGECCVLASYTSWYREESVSLHVFAGHGRGMPKFVKRTVSTGIGSLAVSPDGFLVAIQGRYGEVRIYDTRGEKLTLAAKLPRSSDEIIGGAMSFTGAGGELLIQRTVGALDRYSVGLDGDFGNAAQGGADGSATGEPSRVETSPARSFESRLLVLKELFESGVITEGEYKKRRQDILAEM